MFGTFWALVPPLVAIALALITKEVYSSLFVGIVVGALFYANFAPVDTITTLVNQGLIGTLSSGWNAGILIFLVILGIMVQVINKAGGSAAYGAWANKRIKTKLGAQLSTIVLGCLIFIDDYFNCLTVGSVMRPVTDRHKVSRSKLAYIIDATAAPICMIAPISSWAAAVSSKVEIEGISGMEMFVRAIPYNFYSLLTIVMLIVICVMKFDFGPMKRHELNAEKGDLYTTEDRPYANVQDEVAVPRSKVIDLVLPIVVLIIFCVIGLIYSGGFFSGEGVSFVDAFANSDASVGLALGSLVSLVFTFIYMLARRVVSFKDLTDAIPKGFNAMVPAILILTFAWTLNSMTGLLGANEFVKALLDGSAAGLQNFLPAIIFAVALGLAFSTGTSWGTFGILLPIVVAVFEPGTELLVMSVSACLAGAVCGDHCSPISDTTIMASAGAQCNHVNHVNTQLPYALTVAGVSFVFYIVAGFVQNWLIVLPLGMVAMVAVLFMIKAFTAKKTA
ncbi:MAG: Na+/H+ antiporter NhaC family protein [Oscillospiraceae bacterium]|nr:Na+/H+ antiporter NhaC family protein [Oscillospiraceae bacterium]